MAVGFKGIPSMAPVPGFRIGVASAGVKTPGRRDLVVMELAPQSTCAAVFTRNAFCAAPVVLSREHLGKARPRYLLVNTGNANAGTGERGMTDAQACCAALARVAGCTAAEVLPFSTGVIGEPLPVAKIMAALPDAVAALAGEAWEAAAQGIMTTDTVPKGASRQLVIEGKTVTITGIAKGAGMIRPDMATMLAFVATDAAVSRERLQACLESAVNRSFNRITVDGDTSTNDSCILAATGASGVQIGEGPAWSAFAEAVAEICEELAQAIVRDGEGATKFITVDVSGGRDSGECLDAAYAVAQSPLVKTAAFASDPNWGRILAAVGRAGIADLDLNAVTIHLGDVCIVRNGGRAEDYEEARGAAVMKQEEITIRIDLARGSVRERVWTCDFSYDYVRINAEYRT
ncbi:MAG: bifunctional glutamate N-acetyltransferase/amino-acid acetyltransferase ArgJ [Gammaproteobacteria bacterium]|nr:bifunctional glutamate N-acetyltransferase/amino-acid acetyltransferase ArgJ [Gammaproteobacteria bacterium]